MKLLKLFVSAAALSLAAAGCAMVPAASGVATVPAPALSLKIDWGRRVQAVGSDVARATVRLSVGDRTFVAQASPSPEGEGPKPSPSEVPVLDTVDLSKATGMDLIAGDARVRVEAFDKDGRMIGTGEAVVPLLIGRRSFVQVRVKLDSTGRSDFMPLTPLGPQQSPGWVPSPEPAP